MTAGPAQPSPRPAACQWLVYRVLRKAFEDGKDEPVAADFYCGEMEMRRHERWLNHMSAGRGNRALELTSPRLRAHPDRHRMAPKY